MELLIEPLAFHCEWFFHADRPNGYVCASRASLARGTDQRSSYRLWLIFPSIIVYTLGKDIAHSLWAASRLSDGGRAGGKKGAKVE